MLYFRETTRYKCRWTIAAILVATVILWVPVFLFSYYEREIATISYHAVFDFLVVSSVLIFINVSLYKKLKEYKNEIQQESTSSAFGIDYTSTIESLDNSIFEIELAMLISFILIASQLLCTITNITDVSILILMILELMCFSSLYYSSCLVFSHV